MQGIKYLGQKQIIGAAAFLKKNTTETLFIHPSYFRNHLELADTEQEYINKTPELKAILENKND